LLNSRLDTRRKIRRETEKMKRENMEKINDGIKSKYKKKKQGTTIPGAKR